MTNLAENMTRPITGNPAILDIDRIPVLEYRDFQATVQQLLETDGCHCVDYHAVPFGNILKFFCCIASDTDHRLFVCSHEQSRSSERSLDSLSVRSPSMHLYEREIAEQYGIKFPGHPWLKPVRRTDPYPFYTIDGEGLHEVGVGPIHAGVIEPGYFRFICHGERVLHLEIKLGFQHRGLEGLMTGASTEIRRAVLAERIAGDMAAGHSIAHAQLMEALAGLLPSPVLQAERVIALELERVAMHIGDTAALCTDVAYQFGQVVNEALRTIIINTTQQWCGNRFGKGIIRCGGSHYPLTEEVRRFILDNIREVDERYLMITREIFSNSSVLGRFEGTGRISALQAALIGAVGMAARSSGIGRDIRRSHPFQAYEIYPYDPVILVQGDVWARAMLRKEEVERSLAVITRLAGIAGEGPVPPPDYGRIFRGSCYAISLAEGWRGEIMHSAVTDDQGNIIHYKIKDPSFHNWMALALAVRDQEISDFPLCNKSFNLSYCGHDL